MADTPISGLTSGAPVQGADQFIIARGASNFKITATDLSSFVGTPSIATTDLTDVDAVAPTQTGEILQYNSVSGNYEPSLILDGGLF